MTRANSEQLKHTPWFAKAGAACSIVPISRFVGDSIFALKGGGYGCLFSLAGVDEEGLTDQELEARVRSIEGALRGLPEGSCLYQYTRVMSGFDLLRQTSYSNPVTEVFASDRLAFLNQNAGFRRIDLHWCLTLEPSKVNAFERKPQENDADTSRMLADLQKTATILEGHLGNSLGLRLLDKNAVFQFFSYLFNLEEWAAQDQLRSDTGLDRQIVKNPVAWHSDHLQVGKRRVQMFSLKTTPEASRPCLFSGILALDCDSVLCSTWRVKSTSAARTEIDAQEKFISFFKVGVLTRVMSGRDFASLDTGAGAKAANQSVDDLSAVIRELDKKAQGEYSLGGNRPAESTGQFIVAKFEHDTARPVDGYAAPQLHTQPVGTLESQAGARQRSAYAFTLDKPTRRIPMTNAVEVQSEYRDLPIDWLVESPTNPRQIFDDDGLQELAASIRANGVLQPLLVRPHAERRFEIVFGARRYRGAAIAEQETVPVCIREMTDAQVLEAQLVENLQRRDVHPLDEAHGYARLLALDEPKYSIELIAAKCGKQPGYVASRLRLTELAPAVVEAFSKDEIGLGHALLLAKLQSVAQEEALPACWQESYTNGSKSKRILLPVRHLREWIEHNILLELAAAPFSKEDATLVPSAGSCLECPKRTGHNTLLFADIGANQPDSCSDPKCYQTKVDAFVKQTIASKPKLVQISTAYGKPAEGSPVVPRSQYVAIRQEKPTTKYQQEAAEYKTCKYTTEAIVADGSEKGEIRKVCANPECPVHHPKKQRRQVLEDGTLKAEEEKRRREEAIAQATGLRVLKAIGEAVPVRLMKRDLLFAVGRLASLLDERRLAILIRQHGVGKPKDGEAPAKLLAVFLPKAEESKLGRILVETVILLSMHNQTDTAKVLRDAAQAYKVDIDAMSATIKQEFAAKEKAKTVKKTAPKPPAKAQPKAVKKPAAA